MLAAAAVAVIVCHVCSALLTEIMRLPFTSWLMSCPVSGSSESLEESLGQDFKNSSATKRGPLTTNIAVALQINRYVFEVAWLEDHLLINCMKLTISLRWIGDVK